MGMILDSGCDPLRNYNLWMQSGHDGQMTMIEWRNINMVVPF
jgi:hypothetical protein